MTDATTLFANQPGDRPTAPATPTTLIDGISESKAQRFFDGKGTPAPAETADPYAVQEAEVGRLQYGDQDDPLGAIGAATPEHIVEARRERGNTLFTDGDNAETRLAIDRAITALEPDTPTTLRQASTAEWVAVGNDMGLDPTETLAVAKAAQQAFAAPVDQDVIATWTEQSAQVIRGYGTRGPAVLAQAQQMIANDPRVQVMLARTGLGSHPQLVKVAMSAADRRLRGAR
jgi:hypothetical protein